MSSSQKREWAYVGLGLLLILVALSMQQYAAKMRLDVADIEHEIGETDREIADLFKLTIAANPKDNISETPVRVEMTSLPPARRPNRVSNIRLGGPFKDNPQAAATIVRGELLVRLAPFFRDAHLTLDEQAKVEAALSESEPNYFLLQLVERKASHDPDFDQRSIAGLMQKLEERVSTVIGSERAQGFASVLLKKDFYDAANAVANSSFYANEPISVPQANALVHIMVEASGYDERDGIPAQLTGVDWSVVVAKARTMLTPAQLDALNLVRAKSEFNAQFKKDIGGLPPPLVPRP